jgi:hypothetical protein
MGASTALDIPNGQSKPCHAITLIHRLEHTRRTHPKSVPSAVVPLGPNWSVCAHRYLTLVVILQGDHAATPCYDPNSARAR